MDESADTHSQQPDVAKTLFRAARIVILLLLGCAAIAAMFGGLSYEGLVKLGLAAKFGAMIAMALAIGFLQFRHWAPAVGVSLAPVPAIGLSLVLSAQQPMSGAFHLFAVFPYLLGFVSGLSIADSYVAAIADGAAEYARAIWRSDAPIAAATLVAGAAPALVLALTGSVTERATALPSVWSNAAAILFSALAVPLVCSLGSYGEDFIARTNRIRENRNRWLDLVADVAQPRWSLSAIGTLAVVVVLATFGSLSLQVSLTTRLTHLGVATAGLVILAVAAVTVTQAWRRVLAFVVIMLCGIAIECWGLARAGADLDAGLATIACDVGALMFMPLSVWTANAKGSDDDAATASARATTRKGPIALLSAGSSALLLIPWYVELGRARLGTSFGIIFTALAVAIFLPALANVLDRLAPSRQAIADRYRLK